MSQFFNLSKLPLKILSSYDRTTSILKLFHPKLKIRLVNYIKMTLKPPFEPWSLCMYNTDLYQVILFNFSGTKRCVLSNEQFAQLTSQLTTQGVLKFEQPLKTDKPIVAASHSISPPSTASTVVVSPTVINTTPSVVKPAITNVNYQVKPDPSAELCRQLSMNVSEGNDLDVSVKCSP